MWRQPRKGPKPESLKKKTRKEPQSAEDFIETGLDFEQSGDRWRNQDNPKTSRFYVKAIAAYDTALKLAPDSLDAAYNKARLQLTIATNESYHPPGVSPSHILQEALASHLYCLNLPDGQSEHDIIFNTGQTYVALAEELSLGTAVARTEKAVELIRNGIQMFDRALTVQEEYLNRSLAQDIDMDTEEGGVSLRDCDEIDYGEFTGEEKTEKVEQWAIVKEPVTKSDILDTLLAKLEALTLLCGLSQQVNTQLISDIFTYHKDQGSEVLAKLEGLLQELPDSMPEAALPKANYIVAVADLGFKSGAFSVQQYTEHVQQAFPSASPTEPLGPVMCVNKAEAFIQLAQALSDRTNPNSADVTPNQLLPHYNLAAQLLATAAKEDKNNARLCCLRGDVEMFRSRILFSTEGEKKIATIETLWKNAAVYYRGAKKLSEVYPEGQRDVGLEAGVKEIIVGVQKELYLGTDIASVVLSKAKSELKGFPGWDEIAIEAVKNGAFDEIVLAELENY